MSSAERIAAALGELARDAARQSSPGEAIAAYGRLADAEQAQLLQLADQHRVLLPIGNLLAENLPASLPPSFAQRLERLRAIRELYIRLFAAVDAVLADREIRHAWLTGFAIEDCYPDGAERQFNDLDLLVPDQAALWAAVDALRSLGFGVRKMIIRGRPCDRDGCGLVALAYPTRAIPGFEAQFEIESSGQALWWSSTQRFPDDVYRADHRSGVAPAVQLPAYRWNLCRIAGEMLGRRRHRLRDLADYSAVDERMNDDGHADAGAQLATAGLQHERRRIERVAKAWRAGARYRAREMRLAVDSTLASRIGRSLRLATRHARPYARRRHGLVGAARAVTVDCALELLSSRTARGLAPGLVAWLNDRLDPVALAESGSYVQLVPLADGPVGQAEWCVGPDGSILLRSPIGWFLPVALPITSADTLDAALATYRRWLERALKDAS